MRSLIPDGHVRLNNRISLNDNVIHTTEHVTR